MEGSSASPGAVHDGTRREVTLYENERQAMSMKKDAEWSGDNLAGIAVAPCSDRGVI